MLLFPAASLIWVFASASLFFAGIFDGKFSASGIEISQPLRGVVLLQQESLEHLRALPSIREVSKDLDVTIASNLAQLLERANRRDSHHDGGAC